MTNRIGFTIAIALLAAAGCGDLSNRASVIAARYTRDGTLVLLTPAGIKLYDAELAHDKGTIAFHTAPDYSSIPHVFALSADGKTAAVSMIVPEHKNEVTLYDIPSRKPLRTVEVVGDVDLLVRALALSPDGGLMYVLGPVNFSDSTVRSSIVDVTTGAEHVMDGVLLDSPVFAADGATLFGVVGSFSHATLDARDPLTGDLRFSVPAPFASLTLTDGGATLAGTADVPTAANPDCVLFCPPSYQFRSTVDGSLVRELPPLVPDTTIYSTDMYLYGPLACSTAGDLCASGVTSSGGPRVEVWTPDGTLLQSLPVPAGSSGTEVPNDISLSPDGTLVAVATGSFTTPVNGSAWVYRVADGTLVRHLDLTADLF